MSKIGSLIDYKKGFAFKAKDYLSFGRMVIRVSDFTNNSIDISKCQYIHNNNIDQSKAPVLKTGDIVIATVGSWASNPASIVGKVVRVPKSANGALLNQNAVRIRTKDENCQIFLYYALKNRQFSDYILSTAQGSANQASITLKDILSYEIPDFSYNNKVKIANILNSLDQKIQLNTQTNQTLEAIAQAIFKSWFVDFDPVRAKAAALSEGRSEHEANLAAMSVICGKDISEMSDTEYKALWQIAEAFPSELVANEEFGEVPKGWEVKKIGEVVERLKNSQKLKKEHISDIGETPVFEQGASILMGYTDEHPSQKATLREPIFIFGDHTCITQISTKPFSIYQNVIALKGLNLPTYWVYWAIKDKQKFQEYRRHYMEFIIKEIIVPNDEILCQNLSDTISFFHQKIDFLREENRHLAKIRDELLPKLLSGEIEV